MGIAIPTLQESMNKLLAWLGIYRLKPSQYAKRISGDYRDEYFYNPNWFADNFGQQGDTGRPRIAPSPQRGLFKTALAQLIEYGY